MKLEISLLIVSFITNIALVAVCLNINKNWYEHAEQINSDWYYKNKELIEKVMKLQEKIAEYERKDRE